MAQEDAAILLWRRVLALPRFSFWTNLQALPSSGVYFLFERGETAELDGVQADRIVRVGTHDAQGALVRRIRTHYGPKTSSGGNRASSVFRLKVGEAMMRRGEAPSSEVEAWLTKGPPPSDLEEAVSRYIRSNVTFAVVRCESPDERKRLEAACISMLGDRGPRPTDSWLGLHSSCVKVRESGLWNEQHVSSGETRRAEGQPDEQRALEELRERVTRRTEGECDDSLREDPPLTQALNQLDSSDEEVRNEAIRLLLDQASEGSAALMRSAFPLLRPLAKCNLLRLVEVMDAPSLAGCCLVAMDELGAQAARDGARALAAMWERRRADKKALIEFRQHIDEHHSRYQLGDLEKIYSHARSTGNADFSNWLKRVLGSRSSKPRYVPCARPTGKIFKRVVKTQTIIYWEDPFALLRAIGNNNVGHDGEML